MRALVVADLVLDGEACSALAALLARYVPREAVAPDVVPVVAKLLAHGRQWASENAWEADLRPLAVVAHMVNLSPKAMRDRLRRGTWPGEKRGAAWFAAPPESVPGASSAHG